MRRGRFFVAVLIILGCNLGSCAFHVWAQDADAALGLFQNHTDVGNVLHPGAVVYDPARHSYTISGSGENMWFATDAFQFVWKKLSGDVTLSADISFLTKTGNEHKKAVLMLRQSLDADSVYADVALIVTKRARSHVRSNRISPLPSASGSQDAEITFIWHWRVTPRSSPREDGCEFPFTANST